MKISWTEKLNELNDPLKYTGTMIGLLWSVCLLLVGLAGCRGPSGTTETNGYLEITADVETQPVADANDAADDPAIWIHPVNPMESLLICTNKQSGLIIYDLNGSEVGFYAIGEANNVDIRQGISLGGETTIDIAAGSNRSDNTIFILAIQSEGKLSDISSRKIVSGLSEVYGFCLYHDKVNNTCYAFVNDKSGMVEQWRIFGKGDGTIDAELSRAFRAGQGQLEGCVADDELGVVYIGEEGHGIWKFYAHPDSTARGTLVDDLSNLSLKADIEGLAIYDSGDGKGYLIASSQGNNSFAVYDRGGGNKYLGSFTIVDGTKVDRVSETDGIDVSSMPFGDRFPQGFFIAQDGHNYDGQARKNQNFKLVSWEKINPLLRVEGQ